MAVDLLALGLIAAVSLICMGLGWLLPRLAPRGEESDVPEGDGPDYYALDVPPRLRESRQILRAALEPDAPVDGCECEDCDDLMDVADAVAPDLEGFNPLEAATLRRNYIAMTDDERLRMDRQFQAIVNNHEGV